MSSPFHAKLLLFFSSLHCLVPLDLSGLFSMSVRIFHRHNCFFWIAVAFSLVVIVLQISSQQLDAKSVALLGVLSALIAALRPLGAGAVGIEPMWFVFDS
jgi:hypothetical protein